MDQNQLNFNSMPKRFTDTQKWQDEWFMDLPAKYKLFYLYLLDNCDHAGIWKVNLRLASFHIGDEIDMAGIRTFFGEKVIEFKEGYLFIRKFIQFQYGGLKNDSVGKSVHKLLETNNLLGAIEGLPRTCQGTKVKVKDKVKDNIEIGIENPFSEFFLPHWGRWKEYKSKEHKFKFKTPNSENLAINELFKLSSGNEQTAISIINQSITNGWKGLFAIKNQSSNQPTKRNTGAYELLEQLKSEHLGATGSY